MEGEGFSGGSAGKESTYNARDLSSIPGLGSSPGEGNNYPLQYSGLENFIDCIVHGVTKSQTQLSNFHFTSLHFMEGEELASLFPLPLPHSHILSVSFPLIYTTLG